MAGRQTEKQRLQTVTDSVRIFGKRHQADARLGGRQWLKCQLFDLQQTLVSQLLWLAPRTPASVPRDWLKSTLSRPSSFDKAARRLGQRSSRRASA